MKYIIGVGIKLFLVITVLFSIFSVLSSTILNDMLFISLLLVVVSLFIGDFIIVPRFGNIIGTIADFGLVLAVLLGYGFLTLNVTFIYIVAAVSSAFLIAVGEAFFHYYVQSRLTNDRMDIYEDPRTINAGLNTKLQTEFAKEYSIHEVKSKKMEKK